MFHQNVNLDTSYGEGAFGGFHWLLLWLKSNIESLEPTSGIDLFFLLKGTILSI